MKAKYREICKREATIPLFCRDWWLDAVCGDENWNVFLVEKGGEIVGALPYCLSKGMFGSLEIVMPKLTQHLGIWVKYPHDQNHIKRLSYDKEVMSAVIDQIDILKPAYFSQHFHYSITNWLPFLWRGFQQTTRYTYVLEDLADLNMVYSGFEGSQRRQIQKASKSLTIGHDLSADRFYELHSISMTKSGQRLSYSFPLLENIFRAAYSLDQGKSFYCEDTQARIVGALFIIWDEVSAYHLIPVFDPEYRNQGVGPLLIWEAIQHAAARTRKFDFEGSIVESYERAYRSFGGVQKPYFNIRKTYAPHYMMMDGFNQFKRGMMSWIKDAIRRTFP